ncbi:MAG: nucleotide exchange factor GrpE [Myxococcota bacterium]|nr:nucleotide exchange factor GrpE [Myxococcota bacterium]
MSEKSNPEESTNPKPSDHSEEVEKEEEESAEESVSEEGEVVELDPIQQLNAEWETKLDAKQKEVDELTARLRSVSSAYKKQQDEMKESRERMERQLVYRESRRRGEVVKVLFDPLENLRRSYKALRDSDADSQHADGIDMVIKAFMDGFHKLGLEVIDPTGEKFDPNNHEALMLQPTEDRSLDEVVLQVFTTGYRIEGIVLKPAQVIVGKYNGPPLKEDEPEEEDSKESDSESAEESQ